MTHVSEARLTAGRLRNFLAIVDTGSARAAAAHLSVTESAVSAAQAALHREVGVALLERDGRGLRLTEAGSVFADYARRIIGLMDESIAAARAGVAPERGQLRIGAVTTAGEYLVPGLLAGFRDKLPDVELTLRVGVRDLVFRELAQHRLDVVIGGRPPAALGFVSRATRRNSLVVVAKPESDLAPETATWLLREPGSGTRDATLGLLDSLDVEPPLLTLGSHGAVVASAELGLGLTLVSADAVAEQLRTGALRQIPVRGTPLDRPWHLVTNRNPTATTRLFVGHATDVLDGRPPLFSRRRARSG